MDLDMLDERTRRQGYGLGLSDGEVIGSFETRDRGTRPFAAFGQQLREVVRAGTPGQTADNRLFEMRSATGLNESVSSEGGFLVQSDFSYALLKSGLEASKLASRARPFPIGVNSNGIKLPYVKNTDRRSGYRFGGIRMYWADEAEQKTASKPAFSMLEMRLKKMVGLCYLTDELIEDVSVLEEFVKMAFTDESSFELDDAVLRGTGAGRPVGILNSAALVSVAKESGQAARTIVAANIVKMFARLPASSIETAAWYINSDVILQLMTLEIGTGGSTVPAYIPGGTFAGRPFSTLLGLPVVISEHMETLGTVGDIGLFDMQKYLLGTKGGLQVASSMHVRFIYDESVLRFVYRVDGIPEPQEPITPYKGSDTKSPFIVLATRA